MRHRRSENPQLRAAYPAEPERPSMYRTGREEEEFPAWAARGEAAVSGGWAVGGKPNWRKHRAEWAIIAAVCAALLTLLCFCIANLYRAYEPFKQKKAIVGQTTIAQGVLVDGLHVGGMSRTRSCLQSWLRTPQPTTSFALQIT